MTDQPAVLVMRCPGQVNHDWQIVHECMSCLHYLAHEGIGWMKPPEQRPCPERIGVDA